MRKTANGDRYPNIRSVRADEGRKLVVTWKGDAESTVDIGEHIAKFAIFSPIWTDDLLFRQVAVGELGWCVRWSEDMEISSDTLWQLALEQSA